jgi:hypothetical protein
MSFRKSDDGKALDEGAGIWISTIWNDWRLGRDVEPWIADQFEAIRDNSRPLLRSIYGKANFTERESEIAAEEWHEGLRAAEFWNRILPPVRSSRLVGTFGLSGREGGL